jgi:hypothetical protein
VSDDTDADATPKPPQHWLLRRVERTVWFTTSATWGMRDGRSARWESRAARRLGSLDIRSGDGHASRVEAEGGTARQLTRLNLMAAAAFVIGGSLFSLGALFAQVGAGTTRTVDLTYLAGGFLFSLGGYASVLQANNAPTEIDEHGSLSSKRWHWWRWQPHQIGWLSAAVLFAGTLLFGVSLIAAFAQNLTARQSNGWIWFPDILGCLCFLASGHLALLEVCHGHIELRVGELGWWIVAVNQLGSILFFLAGIAAFTRPATSQAINIGLVNGGTLAGSVCFVIAGALQGLEQPRSDRAERNVRT